MEATPIFLCCCCGSINKSINEAIRCCDQAWEPQWKCSECGKLFEIRDNAENCCVESVDDHVHGLPDPYDIGKL